MENSSGQSCGAVLGLVGLLCGTVLLVTLAGHATLLSYGTHSLQDEDLLWPIKERQKNNGSGSASETTSTPSGGEGHNAFRNCEEIHSDGLQPKSDGLRPKSDGLQPNIEMFLRDWGCGVLSPALERHS